MYSSSQTDNARPFLTWQRILDWAQEHYRYRVFSRDEKVPARSGLLYLVHRGAIRLVGNSQISASLKQKHSTSRIPLVAAEEAFLGFVGAGQPFEIAGSVSLQP
ncbi:MAG: Crp/Fnr family transcriptional regulator, partial [Leptolyngbyaceae cyanobacterium RM2_2_21]|nr:Crp/Fnr family transcriptional regulator [Leptolyngbyaceae cyanobacterium RM2_2_21]